MSANEQLNVTTKSWDIIASRVYSKINANLTLEASGAANLLIKTNGNVIVDADSTGNVIFTKPPICSVLPVVPSQIINKQYADSLITTGAQGAQGSQGSPGLVGAQGSVGVHGSGGAQGAVGAQGTQGSGGAQGPQGSSGLQGQQGLMGSQGSGGVQGAPGSQGFVGSQGSLGSVGAQGPQGSQGSQGPQGAQGLTGFGGDSGSQGSQGSQGGDGSVGGPSFSTNFRVNITYPSSTLNNQAINLFPPINLTSASIGELYITSSADITGRLRFQSNSNTISMFFDSTFSHFSLTKDLKVPLFAGGSGGYAVLGNLGGPGSPLYANTSSLRYKTNIEILSDSDEILKINPVFYNYIDKFGNPKPKKNIGFIAEEMEKNELGNYFVVRNSDGSCETINYGFLIPLYASALRKLKVKLSKLKEDFEELKVNHLVQTNSYDMRIKKLQL